MLPEHVHPRHRFPEDPLLTLLQMSPLLLSPVSFGARLTKERWEAFQLKETGFLWEEEVNLVFDVLMKNKQALTWDDLEKGRFWEDYFDPVVIPTIAAPNPYTHMHQHTCIHAHPCALTTAVHPCTRTHMHSHPYVPAHTHPYVPAHTHSYHTPQDTRAHTHSEPYLYPYLTPIIHMTILYLINYLFPTLWLTEDGQIFEFQGDVRKRSSLYRDLVVILWSIFLNSRLHLD